MHTPEHHAAHILIDLNAIAHNVRTIKEHIGDSVEFMAVVKANAYGHGLLEVSRTAIKNGASSLVVSRASVGVILRQADITLPILILGYGTPEEVKVAAEYNLTLTVNEPEIAESLSAHAQHLNHTLDFHINIDTGMGRFGLLPDEVVPFLNRIAQLPGLNFAGIYTHFSTADEEDKTFTRQQFARYQKILQDVEKAGYKIPLRHVSNSAAALELPEQHAHIDAVRVGIAMYGLRPNAAITPPLDIRSALTLKSHVARVRTLPAGYPISYGRTFITPHEMPVALIPIGYGDGYHRVASNRGAVLIHGKRAKILGRICMDQFVVDISGIENVKTHDEVILIGRQGSDEITAEEVGSWIDSINYEVTTALLPRLPRFYKNEQK